MLVLNINLPASFLNVNTTLEFQNVISAGAERIIVPGQYPLGCFPIYLTAFPSNSSTAYDKHKCLTALNDLAEAHNNNLQHAISTLQTRKPHTKIVYGDYYNAFEWLLNNAPDIGILSFLLWINHLIGFSFVLSDAQISFVART